MNWDLAQLLDSGRGLLLLRLGPWISDGVWAARLAAPPDAEVDDQREDTIDRCVDPALRDPVRLVLARIVTPGVLPGPKATTVCEYCGGTGRIACDVCGSTDLLRCADCDGDGMVDASDPARVDGRRTYVRSDGEEVDVSDLLATHLLDGHDLVQSAGFPLSPVVALADGAPVAVVMPMMRYTR